MNINFALLIGILYNKREEQVHSAIDFQKLTIINII
jgi:hypothetical protein